MPLALKILFYGIPIDTFTNCAHIVAISPKLPPPKALFKGFLLKISRAVMLLKIRTIVPGAILG